MTDLFPITLDDEIAAAEREVKLRKQVYPRFIASGKLTAAKAAREIALMEAIVRTLKGVSDV